ncbi:hypothetical protein L1D15_06285 [Vibrio sp. Isolate25]|nr:MULTISPECIES: hypothetical protein [Vibrio]MCG9596335.1 hypothetical protein [Vibrio sp. Isolate25]USD34779.1 hypothetical protein J8Z27_15720 [Vibrio sp. SCSIO 43186]USD47844.1 hypothetical protein J4N38_16110 [Vibrio sp. SCSIO 43145]USD71904.1 hypothetical protein J4N41_15730 [Vibrio sp. SCSIO 43139]
MFWRTFPDVFAHPIISSNASIEIFLADLADHNADFLTAKSRSPSV